MPYIWDRTDLKYLLDPQLDALLNAVKALLERGRCSVAPGHSYVLLSCGGLTRNT